MESKLEELKKKIEMNLKQVLNTDIAKENLSKKKKLVQTTLFPPINIVDDSTKDLIEKLEKININSITPVDAMKILIDLKDNLAS